MSLSTKLLLLTLVACGGGGGGGGGAPPPQRQTALIDLLNQQRAQAGCAAVGPNDALSSAAQRHLTDMRQNGVRDHTGSDGSSSSDRIGQAGFAGTVTGEVIYWASSGGAQDAVTGWMNSPEHRDVIVDCRFTEAGPAELANGEYFAVVTFGG